MSFQALRMIQNQMLDFQGLEGSQARPPTKLTIVQHHLHTQSHRQLDYTTENEKVTASQSWKPRIT